MTLAEILLASGRFDEAQAELTRCQTICSQRGLAGMGNLAYRGQQGYTECINSLLANGLVCVLQTGAKFHKFLLNHDA